MPAPGQAAGSRLVPWVLPAGEGPEPCCPQGATSTGVYCALECGSPALMCATNTEYTPCLRDVVQKKKVNYLMKNYYINDMLKQYLRYITKYVINIKLIDFSESLNTGY